MSATALRHDWTLAEVRALFQQPFNDLLFQAQGVHRQHFDPNRVQVSTLLSIKTGACPEDCKYCAQSAHHHTNCEVYDFLPEEKIVELQQAKQDLAETVTGSADGAILRMMPEELLNLLEGTE